jgi:hypothetical protein
MTTFVQTRRPDNRIDVHTNKPAPAGSVADHKCDNTAQYRTNGEDGDDAAYDKRISGLLYC